MSLFFKLKVRHILEKEAHLYTAWANSWISLN